MGSSHKSSDMGMRSRTAAEISMAEFPCHVGRYTSLIPTSSASLIISPFRSNPCKPQTHRSSHDIADFITSAVHRKLGTLQQRQTYAPTKPTRPPWTATTTLIATIIRRAPSLARATPHDIGLLPIPPTTRRLSILYIVQALVLRCHTHHVRQQLDASLATWMVCSTILIPRFPPRRHSPQTQTSTL